MTEWLFDRDGVPCLILEESRVRSRRGLVIGWLDTDKVHLLHGEHIGWYEGGVIYDSTNSALAFSRHRTGYLPGVPRVSTAPTLPTLAAAPALPGFEIPGSKPRRGDWSRHEASRYFGA